MVSSCTREPRDSSSSVKEMTRSDLLVSYQYMLSMTSSCWPARSKGTASDAGEVTNIFLKTHSTAVKHLNRPILQAEFCFSFSIPWLCHQTSLRGIWEDTEETVLISPWSSKAAFSLLSLCWFSCGSTFKTALVSLLFSTLLTCWDWWEVKNYE